MLRRDISRTNVLVASAGGMIGSGWLFSPFISAQLAGSHALISWIIAAFFMLFIALPLCELGTMFPISGGMTNYPGFTHGPEVGFLFAWISWLSYVVMTPIEIQAILQYSSYFFPSIVAKDHGSFMLSHLGYICAASIMVFVVCINSFGVKLLAECNKFASIIKFIVPTLAIVSLISTAPSLTHNLEFHLTDKSSWSAIFSALSMGGIAFAFTGFQNGLMLAGEVENPQKNIPIAILGAVLIGFIIYFFLQLSFIVAIPSVYLKSGWAHLSFPGEHGPLVGLTLLVGLGWVAALLLFDAAFSPFGTTLVYTAATSRILYGMALNKHLPKLFLKVNRYDIPYVTLWVNCLVGFLSFLPFPGWQKMVTFLSSCSILSYGIGPICLLAMRKLQAQRARPFRLGFSQPICYFAFYTCNLMLYWCGFDVIWKLMMALVFGFVLHLIYQKRSILKCDASLYWFITYMACLFFISYLGTFGGIGLLSFPLDMVVIFPFSCLFLYLSTQVALSMEKHDIIMEDLTICEVRG
jgi:amino acid transporter